MVTNYDPVDWTKHPLFQSRVPVNYGVYGEDNVANVLVKKGNLPDSSVERKHRPVTTGVLDYFPLAISEVAHVSFIGNIKHNPGLPLHWAREKSNDHADAIGRHLLDRGKISADGIRHSAQLAWRALALLELELEEARGQAEEREEGEGTAHEAGAEEPKDFEAAKVLMRGTAGEGTQRYLP